MEPILEKMINEIKEKPASQILTEFMAPSINSPWILCWKDNETGVTGHGNPVRKHEAIVAARCANRHSDSFKYWVIMA